MISKIISVLTSLIVAAMVFLAATFAFFRFLGAGAYTVLSGSMEPTYKTGSVVYVWKVDPEELEVGDAITFAVADDLTVTHRIVGIQGGTEAGSDEIWFTTKGDANEDNDASPVSSKNIIGKPVFSIPYLGYAITYIKEPPGLYIAIAVVVLLVLSSLAPTVTAYIFYRKDEREPRNE